MKKKLLKGFTLIELIIVMALFSILMVMVMSVIKPISDLFSDSKQFVTDTTVADQIGKFITKNIQYSSNVYIFYKSEPDTTKFKNKNYKMIKLDDSATDAWDGKDYTGRVYYEDNYDADDTNDNIAMGHAFYGRENYTFDVTFDKYIDDNTNIAWNAPKFSVYTYEKESDGSLGERYLIESSAANLVNRVATYIDFAKSIDSNHYSSGETSDHIIYILYK